MTDGTVPCMLIAHGLDTIEIENEPGIMHSITQRRRWSKYTVLGARDGMN
jgi:hypothetical protein